MWEQEPSREGDRERQRARDRDSRREARASPGAINDSTSMRRKDVCLFLSTCYHAKFCTVISSMVDIWIIAATSATLDSGDTEQERHSVEFLCLLFSAPRLFDPITVRGLLRLQAALSHQREHCPCDCFPGFTGCHRYGGKIFSLIMYLYLLCFLWVWVCHFSFFTVHVFCFLKDDALLYYSFIRSF